MKIKYTSELDVFYTDKFEDELKALFGKDKKSFNTYLEWLNNKIQYLVQNGLDIALSQQSKYFEKAKGLDIPLFIIRKIQSIGNPRVIFYYTKDEDSEIFYILLVAFTEDNKSDYRKALLNAENRVNTILNSMEEETNGTEN